MTPAEFVIWLKGFVQAANTYNITPKQWDTVCEYLEKVRDLETNGTYKVSNQGNYGMTTNTTARIDNSTPKTLLTDNTIF